MYKSNNNAVLITATINNTYLSSVFIKCVRYTVAPLFWLLFNASSNASINSSSCSDGSKIQSDNPIANIFKVNTQFYAVVVDLYHK